MTRRFDKISTKIWYAADLGGAELLRGRFIDYAYVHTHDKACFALLTRGAIRIKMRSGEMVARAGDLYAIGAEEPHAGWPVDDDGWSLRTLYVDLRHLQALLDGNGGAPGKMGVLAGPIIRDPDLTSLFHGVHHGSVTAGPSLEREEQYLKFITRLFERHTREPRVPDTVDHEDRAIRLARDFLDHYLDERIRLADIARLPVCLLCACFARSSARPACRRTDTSGRPVSASPPG